MSRLRAVFMGTPDFAVPALEALARSCDVVAVYCQPDRPVGRGLELKPPPVKVAAQALGIPVYQPEKLSAPGEFERLAAFNPDVIAVVAFGQILRQNVLDLPRLGCVNVHSSLLPRWRGAAPIQWAILAGDAETGVSTQKMVLKLDAGDVLMRDRTAIAANETAQTLHDRLSQMGAGLLVRTIEGLASGSLRGEPQDEAQVTLASKLTKEMEKLDPSKSVRELDCQVRALTPWPGTSVWLAPTGERLKIKRAQPRTEVTSRPGELFEAGGRLFLGAADGCLELLEVQPDGKRALSASEFLNGARGRLKEPSARLSWNLV
jgi:methionyl-tRNA formyltransferase